MENEEGTSSSNKRTPEEEERFRRIISVVGFIFVMVVLWYGVITPFFLE